MILLVQKYRLVQGLKDLKNIWKALELVLFALVAGCYGFLFAVVMEEIRIEGGPITLDMLLKGGGLGIFFITFIRLIIPTYKPLKTYFPAYYPISKWKQYLLSIITDLFSKFFLIKLIFSVTAFIFMEKYALEFFAFTWSIAFFAHLLRRTVQYLIDFRFEVKIKLIAISFLAAVISFNLFLDDSLLKQFIFFSACTILLFFAGYYLEKHILEDKSRQFNFSIGIKDIYFKLFYRNKKAKAMYWLNIVLKIVILCAHAYLVHQSSDHMPLTFGAFYLLMSPLILFTNVFFNIWGYWDSLWLNFELRKGDYKSLLKHYLGLMKYPLLIDFLITLPFFFLIEGDELQMVVVYFTATIFLVGYTYFSSIYFPVKYQKGINNNKKVNPIGSLFGMLMYGGIVTIFVNKWLMLLVPLYIIEAIIFYVFAKKYYKDWKYKVYEKLFASN